ncbi:putative enzyme related to lactoylglutathione lyase [Pseudoclavibacter chungangensis]|nr:VOC family protein [Pseudoclavibacter chungangensis]NYJ67301.1 putative enzyme related to lactoylglutathione lyase [Pseudoclavibacter chungangensis]
MNTTTTPVATLAMITLDCAETRPLATFYSVVLDWEIVHLDDEYGMLAGPSHRLGVGRIDDYVAPEWPDHGRKAFHFDLAAQDVEVAAARCVELGATRAEPQPGDTWVVLLDPAGHPFCVSDASAW